MRLVEDEVLTKTGDVEGHVRNGLQAGAQHEVEVVPPPYGLSHSDVATTEALSPRVTLPTR